jgi:RHS repeat-associated protein
MNNHFQGIQNMKRAFTFLALCAGFVQADTVTVTVTRSLPYHQEITPLRDDCQKRQIWSTFFNPGLPPNAILVSSKVTGFVDDAVEMGTKTINAQLCRPEDFTDVDITTNINADGSFEIKLHDWTDDATNANQVLLQGYNTITYKVIDPPPPDTSPTNVEEEVCETIRDCAGNEIDKVCWNVSAGCSTCDSHGSPQSTFGIANFNVRVKDTPIWHDTAVGAPLELQMRFSNYGEPVTNKTFGPKWSCNWNSTVTEINPGTNRLVFPSGSIGLFALSTNGVYLPPGALEGTLTKTSGVYRYEKPDGWSWDYALSAGSTNVYLLSAVRDAWSNTVTVSYTNDRLYRVTQTAPNSGRYLEFAYSGTNSRAISVSTEPAAMRTATFNYSSAGLLTNVLDMGGFSYSYQYTNGYLARVFKGAAERLAVSYSSTPETWTATNTYWVQLTDGGGFTRKYTWEYGAVKEEITRGGTNTLENFYSVSFAGSRGRVLTGISKSGLQQSFQYNSQGRVTNRVDRLGGTWQQVYNTQNRKTSVTDPLGNTTTYVYDSNGIDLLYEIPPIGPVQKVFSYVPGKHAVATESNALGKVVTYSYNALGLVTNVNDGRTTETFSYNAEGRLTARYRNGVLVETNQYDAFGRLDWTRDAAGLEITQTFDGLNRLTSQTFDNNGQISVLSNQYDCCSLSQVKDRRGNVWNYQFNDIGEKHWESNPNGLTTYYTYSLEGQPIVISNALEWTTRQYTPEGRLKRVEYPARAFDGAHAENFWYDNEGRQTKRQTISGAYFKQEYDALGRKTAAYVPDGSTLPYGVEEYVQAESNRYDAIGQLVWTRDIRGMAVSNDYNALGQIVKKTYPDTSTEQWTFNQWGDSTSFKDRAGNISSNLFDNLGRVTKQTDARGFSTSYGYNDADQIAAITNALNQVWQFAYDQEGRVSQVTYPDASTEMRDYDPLGNVTQIVKGAVTTAYTYDALNNRTAVIVDGETIETAAFDGLGRLLASVNADGLSITNAWDSWGELNSRNWPGALQESFQYGDRGLTNALDRLNIATRYVRDSLGRVSQQIDGATNVVSHAYLSNGVNQVASLWDGNSNKTAWAYDGFGNATNKVYADSSQERYQYDRLNRLTNKVDAAGNSTGYGYDPNGNLVSIKYGSLSPVTFGYDALNRRTNMVDAVGTTVWTYDSLGRLATERGPFGTNAVSATYDEYGRVTGVSFGSYSVAYSIDGKGRITAISAPEGGYSYAYSSNGFKRTLVTYPNGVKEVRGYDALTRMTNLVYKKWLTTLLSIDYRQDNGDRRTNEIWSTGRNLAYGYDRAHQLLSAVSTGRASDAVSYAYDKAGNPTSRKELGITSAYTFNNLNQFTSGSWTGGLTVVGDVNYAAGTVTVNSVTAKIFPDRVFEATNLTVSAGTNTLTAVYHGPAFTNAQMVATNTSTVIMADPGFGYDAKGNLTNDSDFVFQYDIANRLTNAISKASGSGVLAARYDGLGRRVEVTRSGSTVERYVYFPGSFLVLAVLDGSNQVKEIYTHGPDLSGVVGGAGGIGGILSVSTNTGTAAATKYFHADAMGNVILVSGSDGQHVASYGFTPFGNLLNQSGDYKARFLYSSKEHDAETGLSFYGLRYLDSTRGAWISRDILGENMQVNLYAFVGNRPLSDSDHIGLVGEGIITLAEIPGVGSQLNTLHARLLDKAVRVSASSVKKAEFTSWLAKVGPEVFVNLYAQAIYDVLQSRLEDVVRNIGVCYRINVEYAASSSEKGSIAVKEHAFPALTQPWTWTTAPTIERSMKYEPCPDNCFWRVYYYVPTSKDFSTWKEVERFSCSGTGRCRKTL